MNLDPRRARRSTLLTVSCVLTLVALGLMVWSVVAPTPVTIMIAMSVGQVVGTVAFANYLLVVVMDLRKARVLSRKPDSEDG